MLRVTGIFIILALLAACFADIEITTRSPGIELGRLYQGFLNPSFAQAATIGNSFLITVQVALAAVGCAVVVGMVLAPLYHHWCIRTFTTFCRSIHELFWALLLMPLFQVTPFCGMLALSLPFSGIFAKIFREIFDESDKRPLQALPSGADPVSRFLFGIAPGIFAAAWKYTIYRVECGLRSSAVLGFLGIPTVGFYLETYFNEGLYAEAAGILYCFFILVWLLRYALTWYVALAFSLYSFVMMIESFVISTSVTQFFFEFLPWPLRGALSWADWLQPVMPSILIGVGNTIVLSLITLIASGFFGILLFPFVSRIFSPRIVRVPFDSLFIVGRTTPEFIIAFVFLIALGPSMLPAWIAMTIHNTAIIAYLAGGWSEAYPVPDDISRRRINRYFFWVLPKLYGHYLAYLFYRWEVIIRESALLGLIGVYTLGFYIDDAIHKDHLDVALVLVLCSALLTVFVDRISFFVRRRLALAGISHSAF